MSALHRPGLGIALMLGFCALIPLGDALAKLLGRDVPVGQLVLYRYVFQAGLLAPLALLAGQSWAMPLWVWRKVALRTVLHIAGIFLMITALQHLPLADAVAIAFVMPFVMLLLGHFVMREQVGRRRVLACSVGFIGTLMVVQPAFDQVWWPALLPLAVAVIFALYMMLTRQIATQVDPLPMQAMSGMLALTLMLPLFWLGGRAGWAAFDTAPPARALWGLIALMGAAGAISHMLMSWSLRYAPASTLAPMQYLEIPFAAAVGFAMFDEWPGPLASLGIAVTIAAGLYIILRERAIAAHPAGQGAA